MINEQKLLRWAKQLQTLIVILQDMTSIRNCYMASWIMFICSLRTRLSISKDRTITQTKYYSNVNLHVSVSGLSLSLSQIQMTFYPLEKLGMKPAVLELSIDVKRTEFYCIPTQLNNLYLKGNCTFEMGTAFHFRNILTDRSS